MKFKESELSKERSIKNKANVAKKMQFYRLSPGGYAVGMPKWDKSEQEMEDAGVTPVTRSWPPRCRTWFYALKGAEDKLLEAIEDARKGVFTPNRENDELTRALGNPEHPGRTRGKGVIPWYEGFSEWNDDYRTRARKKMEEEKKRKLDEDQRKQDAEHLQGLEARHADLALKFQQQQQHIDSLSQERGSQQRQQQADDHPALDSTIPSMPRSSVGSVPGDALLDTYPVDDIIENTNCELHFKIKNISVKAADIVAYTNPPRSNLPLQNDSRRLCSCRG